MEPKPKRLTTWNNPFISGADIVRGSRTVRIPTGNDSRRIQSERPWRPGKGNPLQIRNSATEKLISYENLDIPLVDEEIKKPIVKNLYEAFLRIDFLDKEIRELRGKLNRSISENKELNKRTTKLEEKIDNVYKVSEMNPQVHSMYTGGGKKKKRLSKKKLSSKKKRLSKKRRSFKKKRSMKKSGKK